MSKRPRGRPPKNLIVPHPLKGGEWLQVGRYDKAWPAANRYFILRRQGVNSRKALEEAVKGSDVDEQSLSEWLNRSRKRGPIEDFDDYD